MYYQCQIVTLSFPLVLFVCIHNSINKVLFFRYITLKISFWNHLYNGLLNKMAFYLH